MEIVYLYLGFSWIVGVTAVYESFKITPFDELNWMDWLTCLAIIVGHPIILPITVGKLFYGYDDE